MGQANGGSRLSLNCVPHVLQIKHVILNPCQLVSDGIDHVTWGYSSSLLYCYDRGSIKGKLLPVTFAGGVGRRMRNTQQSNPSHTCGLQCSKPDRSLGVMI
jgi:hypothetical protein